MILPLEDFTMQGGMDLENIYHCMVSVVWSIMSMVEKSKWLDNTNRS